MAKSIFDFIYGEDRFEPSDNGVLAQIDALNRRADPNPPTQESTQQTPLPNTWYNNLSRVANRTEQDATGTNIPRNIAQIGKGLIDMGSYVINNPVESANIVGNITSGLVQQVVPESMEWNPEAEDMIDNAVSMIADHYKKSYGSMEGFRDYVRETPIDAFADLTGVGLLSKFGREALINAVNTPRFAEKIDELSRQLPETQMSGTTQLFGSKKGLLDDEEKSLMKLAEKEIEQSKNFDSSRELSAYDERRIWEKYGWYQDSDGSMFFEIDDAKARFDPQPIIDNMEDWKVSAQTIDYDKPVIRYDNGEAKVGFYNTTFDSEDTSLTLSDILKHDELYARYPEIADVGVDLVYGRKVYNTEFGIDEFIEPDIGYAAAYSPKRNKVTLPINPETGLPDENAITNLLHETQHIIQLREGAQFGASVQPEFFQMLKNQIYRQQIDMFGKNNKAYEEIKPLYYYAYDKKQQKYYEDLANRENLTGIARHINNVYIKEVDDALRKVPVPRKAKTPEYNDYLRLKAMTIADYYKKKTANVDFGQSPNERQIKKDYESINAKDKLKSVERKLDKLLPDARSWKKAQNTLDEIEETLKIKNTGDLISDSLEETKRDKKLHELYKRVQGEIQARNVEIRKRIQEGTLSKKQEQMLEGLVDTENYDPKLINPRQTADRTPKETIAPMKQDYVKNAPINLDADIDFNIEGEDFGGVLSMVGKPKKSTTVYHGTDADLTQDTIEPRNRSGSDFGTGIYWTSDKNLAKEYGKNIYQADVSFKKPLILEHRSQINGIFDELIDKKQKGEIGDDVYLNEYLKSQGYDGIIVKDATMGGDGENKIPFFVSLDKNSHSNFGVLSMVDKPSEFKDLASKGQIRQARTTKEDIQAVKDGDLQAIQLDVNYLDLSDAYEKNNKKWEKFVKQFKDKGLIVDDDMYGNLTIGTKEGIAKLKNAETPYDYGNVFGYSEEDIASFYKQRAGGNTEIAMEEFIRDKQNHLNKFKDSVKLNSNKGLLQ